MQGEDYRNYRIGIAQKHLDNHAGLDAIHNSILRGNSTKYRAPRRRFRISQDWDLDSTPKPARIVLRAIGARTPEFEEAIILASLPHDIRYYYGGSLRMKVQADADFEADLRRHAKKTGAGGVSFRAWADKAAVAFGGANPFASYGWGYGLSTGQRLKSGIFKTPTSSQVQAIQSFVRFALQVYEAVWRGSG